MIFAHTNRDSPSINSLTYSSHAPSNSIIDRSSSLHHINSQPHFKSPILRPVGIPTLLLKSTPRTDSEVRHISAGVSLRSLITLPQQRSISWLGSVLNGYSDAAYRYRDPHFHYRPPGTLCLASSSRYLNDIGLLDPHTYILVVYT